MGQAEELLRMGRKLEKMVSRKNTEGALDLLKKLNNFTMTIQLLQTTRIGVAVNTVRKHCSNEEVVALAKILVKNWKKLLESSGAQKSQKEKEKGKGIDIPSWKPEDFVSVKLSEGSDGNKKDRKSNKFISQSAAPKSLSLVLKPDRDSESSISAAASTSSSSPKSLSGERRSSTCSNPASSPTGSRKKSTDGKEERSNSKPRPDGPKTPTSPISPMFASSAAFLPPCYLTGDTVRDKCIEMISGALKMDDDYKEFGVNCDKMGAEIEDHIYQELKGTDMKYRNRVRSRISNLKDPKNPSLRRNVLSGAISPSLIAKMTAEEMASDELKELRNAMTQEAIREHQMAKTGGTATDLFQCGKCKKKNCTYNQVQTRSADEPMTTFVLCNECGNRWKFC
ncbi:transcription elongation factor A protein 3 isoform X2 [Sphaerodactylus townsendi]|uniref:transcription elongation factor A protein 3 isoform X2 n=1 Tax=Sphaerodactylus townsendi TaxID=933632 RepID=UPI00202681A9|nr:transcription elongation factor A protein 3 isoform X2 [Sphaerodactylus townsendi]